MRLTATSLKIFRGKLITEQHGICKLCETVLDNPCADHDHKTGAMRDVLCRGCNAMLGHIENNMPRHKLNNLPRLARFLGNVASYIARHKSTPRHELHPTHRTDEEKRLLRNKRARTKRASAT